MLVPFWVLATFALSGAWVCWICVGSFVADGVGEPPGSGVEDPVGVADGVRLALATGSVTFTVPVMKSWKLQRNVYVPSGNSSLNCITTCA